MSNNTQLAEVSPQLNTGLSIFDGGTFEGIMRVADAMAYSPLVPESLRTKKENGKTVDLSHEQIRSNCFLVCEQAARWEISPFAALACASNIHGRMMWEGKLVAGVLDAKMGVSLDYEYSGQGDNMTVTVKGTLPGETQVRTVSGTVRDWKTDQWKSSAYEQRLAYRGAREWARRHKPSIMLGVLTDDETLPEIRDVTPKRAVVRENPISPFDALPEPQQEAAPVEEAKPKPQTIPANPATIPAAGRQKKDRIQRDATYKAITEREGNGKTFWEVSVNIAGKVVAFTTFSETLSGHFYEMEPGTPIRITVVPNADGKTFALEDFQLLTAEEEGGLV